MFKGLGYSLKQAFVQIFRNKGMTVASLFAITAMLLILGLFFFPGQLLGLQLCFVLFPRSLFSLLRKLPLRNL